ncbi:MAG: T9SS type A sorting domain-containing protein, partial [Flavobacteriales bacterium]|nr:T9SS type A sorting domain-containing protein [Flavobacteriales bacterium]
VSKVGNDAFTFPIGRNGQFRPMAMSAPSSAGAEFRGEYFEHSADADFPLSSRDTTLVGISSNEFWTLERLASTSNVSATLAWDSITSCAMDTPLTAVRVAGWDGTKWADRGNGGTTGTIDHGTVVSSAAATVFHAFTVGHGTEDVVCREFELSWAPDTLIVDSLALFYLNSSNLHSSYSLALYVQGTGLTTGDTYRGLTYVDTVSTMVHLGDSIGELTAVIYVVNNLGAVVDSLVYDVPYKWVATGGGFVCDCTPPACELIGNGSFENNTSPPSGDGQVGTNVHCWNKVVAGAGGCTPIELNNLCTNHNGTPDYFHPGSSAPNFSAPFNNNAISFGQVPAFNGSAYVGLAAAHSINQTNYFSEYLTQPLSSQIIAGNTYTLTFQLYLSRYSDRAVIPGVVLSNAPLCQNNYSFIPQTAFPNPSLYLTSTPNQITGYLITTGVWHEVTITFTPTSNFNTITIGHFSPPPIWINNTTAWATPNQVQPPSGFNIRCYWFIDDVSLQAILPSELSLDVDNASCHGADDGSITIALDPPLTGQNIIWTPPVAQEGTGTATGLGPGQYSVTVVHPSGCATAETEVTEPPAISATLSNASYCPNRGVSLTSLQDAALPVTLDWQPAQYLQDNTALFAEIDHGNPPPGPTQTFTLTVTDNNGCTGEFQTNIGIGDCCFGPVTYDEFQQPTDHTTHNGDNDLASVWGATLSPAALGVNAFAINGTFTVDEDLTIEDMDIILGPMAQIVIAANKELTVSNSHLYPCSSFWHRVEAGADAALVIEDGSILEQAYTAVHAHDGGTFHITNSTFDRNLIHISVHDYATTPNPAVISGNDLVCTQPLAGTGLFDRTYHGIYARNVSELHVGAPYGNHFEHARFGIRSVASGLYALNNTFTDMEMLDDANGGLHFSGFGIHAVGTSGQELRVSEGNAFSNSSRGVAGYLFGSAEVKDNTFDAMIIDNETTTENYGFGALLVGNQTTEVITNVLIDCELGIQTVQQSGTVNVEANNIYQDVTNTYDQGIGVAVSGNAATFVRDHREGGAPSFDGGIKNMRIGILAQNANRALAIFENELWVNTDGALHTAGIHTVNCTEPRIRGNTVVSDGTDYDFGIITQGSAHASVYCNILESPNVGVLRMGEAGGYLLNANLFTGAQQLVSLWAYQSSFPQQGEPEFPADNQWDTDTDFGYHTYNSSPAAIPGRIYVRPNAETPASSEDLSYNPTPFEVGTNSISQFVIEKQPSSPTYSPNESCEWSFGMSGLEYVRGIALDTLTYLGDTAKARIFSKLALYRAALADSSLAADSIVALFVDSMRHTKLAVLDSIQSEMKWGMDTVAANRLQAQLNKLTPTDSIESLWIETNSLIADLLSKMDTVPDGSAVSDLEALAALCPLDHGPAIYAAREILMAVDGRPRVFLNDCENPYIPQPPSERLAQPESQENKIVWEPSASIRPNPSSGDIIVTIHSWDGDSETYRFELLDPIGKPLFEQSLASNENRLTLSFASGLYLYRVTDSLGKKIAYGRLVIVH